jgi:hypothetical protein
MRPRSMRNHLIKLLAHGAGKINLAHRVASSPLDTLTDVVVDQGSMMLMKHLAERTDKDEVRQEGQERNSGSLWRKLRVAVNSTGLFKSVLKTQDDSCTGLRQGINPVHQKVLSVALSMMITTAGGSIAQAAMPDTGAPAALAPGVEVSAQVQQQQSSFAFATQAAPSIHADDAGGGGDAGSLVGAVSAATSAATKLLRLGEGLGDPMQGFVAQFDTCERASLNQGFTSLSS